jgi:hypothetical protein
MGRKDRIDPATSPIEENYMNEIIKEVNLVAKIHGYEKLKDIKMVDKTRYSALVGKTGVRILVDIQSENVWQWQPYKKKLVLQQRKVGG